MRGYTVNKEEVLFQLTAIAREVAFMSQSRFEEGFKDGVLKFRHFCWGERAKIDVQVHVQKTPLQLDDEA